MVLIILGAVFSILALLLMLLGAKMLISRGWFLAWVKGSSGFAAVGASCLLISMMLDLFSYSAIEADRPLVTVSISERSSQLYDVELVDGSGDIRTFELAGDQWQLDVRLLTVASLSSVKLDRISGRYLSLEQNDSDIRTVHDLWSQSVGLVWLAVDGLMPLLPFVEESTQQVAFVPMSDGAIFQVYWNAQELDVVPTNAQAKFAMQ